MIPISERVKLCKKGQMHSKPDQVDRYEIIQIIKIIMKKLNLLIFFLLLSLLQNHFQQVFLTKFQQLYTYLLLNWPAYFSLNAAAFRQPATHSKNYSDLNYEPQSFAILKQSIKTGTTNITNLVGIVLLAKVVNPKIAPPKPKPIQGIFQELENVLLKSHATFGLIFLYRSTYYCVTCPTFCFAFKTFNLKVSL